MLALVYQQFMLQKFDKIPQRLIPPEFCPCCHNQFVLWLCICNHLCEQPKRLDPAQPRQAVLLTSTLGHEHREQSQRGWQGFTILAGIPAKVLWVKLPAETTKQPCQMLLGIPRALAKEALGQSNPLPQQDPSSGNRPLLHPSPPTYRAWCQSVFWCLLMLKFQIQQILCSFSFYSSETPS